MQEAITELEVKLETYRTNEPIWRSEGNVEQADLCLAKIDSVSAAIERLNSGASA